MKDNESWETDGFTPGFALVVGLVIFCLMLFGELMGGWFLIAMLLTSTALVILVAMLFYFYYEGLKREKARRTILPRNCITCGGYDECTKDPSRAHFCQSKGIGKFSLWRPEE